MLEKQLDHVAELLLARVVQWRPQIGVSGVRIGVRVEEHPHDRECSRADCPMQRASVIVVGSIDVGLVAEKPLDDSCLATRRGDVQRRGMVGLGGVGALVDRGAVSKHECQHVVLAVLQVSMHQRHSGALG